MGLGPSIKMTTLHHFRCPVTRELMKEDDLEFCGIIVNGVSEGYDDKVYSAIRTGEMAEAIRADGAIVAIDGWGNHHIDFVNVIEELGKRNIPAIGLSYIGLQGRLVCTNEYVDTVIDFNKNVSGYESCVVGDNNVTEYDAMKAVALVKMKMNRWRKNPSVDGGKEKIIRRLVRKKYAITEAAMGEQTEIADHKLVIRETIVEGLLAKYRRIREAHVSVVQPGEHDFFVNSNLDYMPIACKPEGILGEGETILLTGITAMLTGVEAVSGFQPSNIGSSEGILKDRVKLDEAGTPGTNDIILHIDFLFEEGEGRTAEGIMEAHRAADEILNEIRRQMIKLENVSFESEYYQDRKRPGRRKVILVKVTSGLGNMYDTAVFPSQPGGILGSRQLRSTKNTPIVISPCQCLDGVIHTLL